MPSTLVRYDRFRGPPGLYLLHLHLHGLLRGQALELGRDADTGARPAMFLIWQGLYPSSRKWNGWIS
ncbi:hypothetical protein L1047_14100 [Synechococcus sp. Nb3U1]|uniref:hypothetical protein n=1 Tax=Synechococcus sp. Nb3U1 TaxID=1914529 RepID=UPI001F4400AE|nr:hypothetical protein [Synechococcus sp. Nb3U1]MCF2972328.1 hypothetical protein [Synechococcus sp. Nb3U1]